MKGFGKPFKTFVFFFTPVLFLVSFPAGESRATTLEGRVDIRSSAGHPNYYLAQAGSSYPRNPSSAYLGEYYRDQDKGFTIRPPGQWLLNKRHPRFAVMFSSMAYDAYIIVDVLPVPTPVLIDKEFTKFISEKNKEVKSTIPSFQVLSNRKVKLKGLSGYRTDAVFTAGPNRVLMSIYYIPAKTRIFMITTICPEATAQQWEPLLDSSLRTFSPLE